MCPREGPRFGFMEPRLDTQTGYLLVKLGALAGARFDGVLAPLGLRGRHVRVIEEMRGASHSQQELCQATGLDRTTMVAVLDDLEQRGYARRSRSTADRRKHVVTLTGAGERAFKEAARALADAQEAFLAPLSAGERDQLRDLVERLRTTTG